MSEENIIKKPIEVEAKPEENKVENTQEAKPEEISDEVQNNISASKVINLTDENFDTEVLKSSKPIVVDFWAEWRGPCKMVGPILNEISIEMTNEVNIAKHNIDEEPNTPTKYGVRGIPTMILMKDGNHVSTKVGAVPKSEIVSWIKENI